MSSGKTAALPDGDIFSGETKSVYIIVIDGSISTTPQVGEIIEVGTAQKTVGRAEVAEISEDKSVI